MIGSFDALGYARHARHFTEEPERPLGRVLITGGTAGIGRAAARALAARGARPTLWGRSPERGIPAAEEVGGTFASVDLADLDAVSRAAWGTEVDALSAVVLNAGAMPRSRRIGPQGHEQMWASQVLGHTLLLRILRRRAALSDGVRVVWVSSGGMYLQQLDLEDLRWEQGYRRHVAYANAKRAQVILNEQLAQRWGLRTAAMHPGWVDTAAVQHSMPWFRALTRPVLRTWAQGADTIVWLVARAEAWPSGRFWFDRTEAATHWLPGTRSPEADREALWAHVQASTDRFLGRQ